MNRLKYIFSIHSLSALTGISAMRLRGIMNGKTKEKLTQRETNEVKKTLEKGVKKLCGDSAYIGFNKPDSDITEEWL